jgi:hypothetical protein
MLDKCHIPAFLLPTSPPLLVMKKLLLTLSLLAATLQAADTPKSVTYEGKITGVVCVSCKEHVAGALMQKLPGVVSVDVKPGDAEANKLIIVANSDAITKESATEALGTYAKNYSIVSLAKKQ